ncbi:Protein-lysine N-methyltransferase efm4 [Elasticomyces elasticus]|uniref:Protein-lysine N-methyltransferase EFM4 n=1 Tax=Exophiala sideris TaxID=1016849 RepID=A0ABR0JL25_9EURO|nr:Protein-lysine N-methyltransferase efm4 [Elasticomyces elasticus]KAK5036316.1 Protein-lysine N-methyltransferase efm4 [Exophiala sideris]KAK5041853.1 Protein-lysine N-methyltransferase efm4 [Exophiala sideris]KAK5066699.1 Protein-lysine N-methyltransferase efm4 [Exophiala sideris]KAK5184757.1 Protein-lysine N-methyltransferase efm4 [Eurotiomycetes sp. CCFEE 6388]
MPSPPSHPTHLDPSELGTKEYWDKYYQNDLDNADVDDEDEIEDDDQPDPSDLESWFDDVGAPAKTLEFLTSETFPLSPNYNHSGADETSRSHHPSVLDLGTGNGSALFALRFEGGYTGRMVGVDYSRQSVELARKLARQYISSSRSDGNVDANVESNSNSKTSGTGEGEMSFEILDLIHDTPSEQNWWPEAGFDLVLDKGTFDAISLSSATVLDSATDQERRICEMYPAKVLEMVRPEGFLLVTSCNWTEDEVVSWFTNADSRGTTTGKFEVYDRIRYPVFEFGGQKGQGVASVCFRKTADESQ